MKDHTEQLKNPGFLEEPNATSCRTNRHGPITLPCGTPPQNASCGRRPQMPAGPLSAVMRLERSCDEWPTTALGGYASLQSSRTAPEVECPRDIHVGGRLDEWRPSTRPVPVGCRRPSRNVATVATTRREGSYRYSELGP